ELRYLASNPGDEGIAVGSGPGAIAIGVRIPRNRRLDAFDELFDAGAAVLGEQAGPGIEPEEVGRSALGGGHHRTAAAQVPAEHVVNCVLLGSFALGGNPGVDSEGAAPVERAGAVDLDDRRGPDCGRGGWLAAGAACLA